MTDKSINKEKKKNLYEKHVNKFLPRYRLIAFIKRATSESSTFNSRNVRRILP